jgi:phospholipase/carboxylesterase
MTTKLLQCGVLDCHFLYPTPNKPRGVIAVLHGYGMQASDLLPLVQAMSLPVAIYAPEARNRVSTGGRTWWPTDEAKRRESVARGPRNLATEFPLDRDRTRRELAQALADIRGRHAGLPLFLIGFSQGGMLACDLLLHTDTTIDGLFLLSASCIAAEDWEPNLSRLSGVRTLISHGRRDKELDVSAGEQLRDTLARGGALVTWVPFDGAHEIPLTVWRKIRRTLSSMF